MRVLDVSFEHLSRLTDNDGIVEHAKDAVPRLDCGYCLDDAARGLVVVSRESPESQRADELARLGAIYLSVVLRAQAPGGQFHNRLDTTGRWTDVASLEDCWGRALWGLGSAAARSPRVEVRDAALRCFERSAGLRSPWRRAMAFAALGASELLVVDPDHRMARDLVTAAIACIRPSAQGRPSPQSRPSAQGRPETPGASESWPWPEPRLRYANAAIPEALIVGGRALGDDVVVVEGLELLEWLCDIETRDGHFSVTPVGGWALGETRPGFDQQPIEVAALADACASAFDATGEHRWVQRVELAQAWFLGDNDAGAPLFDPATGGGCDGLEPNGANMNQGAESTLALVSTFQQARRLRDVNGGDEGG